MTGGVYAPNTPC